MAPKETGQALVEHLDEDERRDVVASQRGDEDAYARLVRRCQATVAAQMGHFTRDRQELEALVQEVFVEAYFSLASYRGEAPFLHWLRRIASRTGYRHWRHKARDRQRRERLAQMTEQLTPPPECSEPSEAGAHLFRLLEQLPAKERLVLTLLYFEECGTAEIAARMGWSRSLVKVRAFRARQRLRNQMEAAGYGKA